MGPMELFRVAGKLVLDKSGFDDGLNAAVESGQNFSEKLNGIMEKAQKFLKGSLFVIAAKKAASAVWGLAKDVSAAGDAIDKQSQALGMSRKAYQEWGYILGQNGASIESMELTMRTMTSAIAENSKETAGGLAKLGLSAARLQSMSPEKQFETMVKAFQKMPEGAQKSQLAIQLFGRNAQSLMPLLNSSTQSMEELRQRAHDLGLIMSDEDVDASVAFGDALDDLNNVWTALKQKFGAQMLPTFTRGLVAAANALGRITNAVSEAFVSKDWSGVFGIITEEIGALLPRLMDTLFNLVGGIIDNAPKIIDIAASILEGLARGLSLALPKLVRQIPSMVRRVWESMKRIIVSLGNGIIGVINEIFGLHIPEIKELKWPTWAEVKSGFETVWGEIKTKAEAKMKLVFGETEDGGIDWKAGWEKVKTKFTAYWDKISGSAGKVMRLIFGETEDGSIDWKGGWAKLITKFKAFWESIKTNAVHLMRLKFGETADGGIDWHNAWDKISGKFVDFWKQIKSNAKHLMKLAFGETEDGGIAIPSADSVWEKIKTRMTTLWQGVQSKASGLLTFSASFFVDLGAKLGIVDDNGNLKFPEEFTKRFPKLADNISSILTKLGFLNEDGTFQLPTEIVNLFTFIKNTLSDILHFMGLLDENDRFTVPAWFSDLWGIIKVIPRSIMEALGFRNAGEMTEESIEQGVTNIRTILHSILDALGFINEDGVFAVPEWLKSLPQFFGGVLTEVLTGLGFKNRDTGEFETPEWLSSLTSTLTEVVTNLADAFGFIGENGELQTPGWLRTAVEAIRKVLDAISLIVSWIAEKLGLTAKGRAQTELTDYMVSQFGYVNGMQRAKKMMEELDQYDNDWFKANDWRDYMYPYADPDWNPYTTTNYQNTKRPPGGSANVIDTRNLTGKQKLDIEVDEGGMRDAVAAAVQAAVANIQINLDGQKVGAAVAPYVSRQIYQNGLSRRFSV